VAGGEVVDTEGWSVSAREWGGVGQRRMSISGEREGGVDSTGGRNGRMDRRRKRRLPSKTMCTTGDDVTGTNGMCRAREGKY